MSEVVSFSLMAKSVGMWYLIAAPQSASMSPRPSEKAIVLRVLSHLAQFARPNIGRLPRNASALSILRFQPRWSISRTGASEVSGFGLSFEMAGDKAPPARLGDDDDDGTSWSRRVD